MPLSAHRARTLILLFAILLGIASCASRAKPAADNARGKAFAPPPAGALITLLPPGGDSEIEKGLAMIYQQTTSQLRAAGYRVATLDRGNYNSAWAKEVAAVGGIFDPQTGAAKPQAYGTAMAHFARQICSMTNSVMILQPRLVNRTAELHGSSAEWDGHIQAIPVVSDTSLGYTFKGTAPGLSVEQYAIMADGTLGFRMYGGVTMPYRSNMREVKNELRKDLFADDREVAGGVTIALEPLLVK